MVFANEAEFENAVVAALLTKGWKELIQNPTEQDLINNWANILFQNNNTRDRLNDAPLTETEMAQILEQVTQLRTPLKLNGFINGKTISIQRDNPADPEHQGKEISLKIFDPLEISGGQSTYQIVQQPRFATDRHFPNRRGDLMLLINGMPVIHLELKHTGVDTKQAANQIAKYSREGVFTGIFSLVQIFVAMSPEETIYFANPGPDGKFNPDYYFHWADFNNEPVNKWEDIVSGFLYIPMVHQLIGAYTVADDTDGMLKVMRSYQYYAASRISDRVSKIKWGEGNQLGGYIWHTTGSGKTMTSFKSAQLIADSKDADKVVFLMDRIELGTQSLMEYRGFAAATQEVQETEDSHVLISKLKSSKPQDTLIVTSIQKMSLVNNEDSAKLSDLREINKKRVVFIVDEAHRSTFGEMLAIIKRTFPRAVFFGFTGTPIHMQNQRKHSTTATIFGDELHRYSIADGIRDGNVLGFDPTLVETVRSKDLREKVARIQAGVCDEDAPITDPDQLEIYYHFMDTKAVPMAGTQMNNGDYVKGIEDYVKADLYQQTDHYQAVTKNINDNWARLSRNSKFHAILAVSSIPEAIEYYRILKENYPHIKTTALFDANIDNSGEIDFKEDGLIEILEDYNERYGQDYTISSYYRFKKDVAARLAHKRPYQRIETEPEKQVDLLIVVNQMLTGFDSKWLNTLYLDKVMEYVDIVQAFSRTNRLFAPGEKPFGSIVYYRKPYTMKQKIEEAFELYSGNNKPGIFVEQLDQHLEHMNEGFRQITRIFTSAGIPDYSKLPESITDCKEFARLFVIFHSHLEAALIQGFYWEKLTYKFKKPRREITVECDYETYQILLQRYKELDRAKSDPDTVPFDIERHITEIDTDRIDSDYLDSRFKKYLKALATDKATREELDELLDPLFSSFATLSQEEQKYARLLIHDIEAGEVQLVEGKTFRDYINEYQYAHQNHQVKQLVAAFGIDEDKLTKLMNTPTTGSSLNEFGRYDDLKETVNKTAAREFFSKTRGISLPPFKVNIEVDKILKQFLLEGELPEEFDQ
ncbi:type I restriction endonuclease subunit R [Boudabousia marimammalium]|uniref:Type I restriction enzyme endonuclease subunit n=1 Tax=Boudabousia marimammalium TaxID=156892 RepID=A0A1Q5PJW7_9ACTO|nr:HsdR family type I site-specific deoxyribonuclease [Boudabousia marimammalium]OKL46225.1 DEAD/DEAH box helicase [Boudabousia marimammalium]